MEKEQEAIEVEIVEIDGIAPVHPTPETERRTADQGRQDWQKWQGRIRRLDARWWPLWLLLGIVLLFLLLTVGVVLGAIYLVYRIIRDFLLGIAAMFRS